MGARGPDVSASRRGRARAADRRRRAAGPADRSSSPTATARAAAKWRRSAPMPAIAQRSGGHLVLDDTQALGILGEHPDVRRTRTARAAADRCAGIARSVATSSRAARWRRASACPSPSWPGERELIERFRRESETRVHCSPPSVAVDSRRATRARGQPLARRRAAPPPAAPRHPAESAVDRRRTAARGPAAVPGADVPLGESAGRAAPRTAAQRRHPSGC